MQIRRAATIGALVGGGAAMAGAVHYNRPGPQSTLDRVAINMGYLPAAIAIPATVAGLPLLIHPKTRHLGGLISAAGAAAVGAAFVGTTLGRASRGQLSLTNNDRTGTGTQHATLPPPDMQWAREAADTTLQQIDTSRDTILLHMPGTMRNSIPGDFRQPAREFLPDASIVKLPTHNDYDVRQGAANLREALKLVLDELAERAPDARVVISGESVGSWAFTEVADDPAYRDKFDRAIMWGHPAPAEVQPEDLDDVGIAVLRDEYDATGAVVRGDQDVILSDVQGMMEGRMWHMTGIVPAFFNNPWAASLLVRTGLRQGFPDGYGKDPHNYRETMRVAAQFLASTSPSAGGTKATDD